MNVYLDTFTIQKWVNKTLTSKEIDFLNEFFSASCNNMVLASNHMWEICSRSDRKNAIKIGEFLDKLPGKLYIISKDDIEPLEIMQSYRMHQHQITSSINVFDKSLVHTLACDVNALELRLHFEKSSIVELIKFLFDPVVAAQYQAKMQKKLDRWADYNNKFSKGMDSSKWKSVVKKNLRIKIIELIIKNNFSPDLLADEDFIKFILENYDKTIPGICLAYYVQHYMHRNSPSFKTSDINDLAILTYLPYVEYMVIDKPNYERVIKTIKTQLPKSKATLLMKVNATVEELSGKQ